MFLSSALLTLVLPAFAGGKNEVSIETIEIAHHGIEVGLVVLTDDNDTTIATERSTATPTRSPQPTPSPCKYRAN